MIKTYFLHQLGTLQSKYAEMKFLELFRERKFIYREGDEFLVETKEKEFQAYFVTENGKLVESDVYKMKQK